MEYLSIVSLDGGTLLPLHFPTALVLLFEREAMFVCGQLENREERRQSLKLLGMSVSLYHLAIDISRINISRKEERLILAHGSMSTWIWASGSEVRQSPRSEGAQPLTSWRSGSGETAQSNPVVWASSSQLCSILTLCLWCHSHSW